MEYEIDDTYTGWCRVPCSHLCGCTKGFKSQYKYEAYEVQLQEEADCKEALWCNLVTGHTTVTIGVVYRCPNITIQNNEKIHKAISEVSKGDCIIMGDFNHGNIKWDSQQSTGVEDQINCILT